ncbi:hypothetical protein [Streptomyces sp. TRM68367]|uniref:hypothetical protein n=1 Tax=Streptomyces sp. TRM68367 TaxID=2758415 RepID=UPI00165BE59C|nr:hypothetical protein [Streptomyces sp. TRM68367]MBC9730707.1 hypothetical protein [Streptomyces sp. TRM68367]
MKEGTPPTGAREEPDMTAADNRTAHADEMGHGLPVVGLDEVLATLAPQDADEVTAAVNAVWPTDEQPAEEPEEPGAQTLAHVFATVDRSYEPGSVTQLVFMHNGGRSKYDVMPIHGRKIPMAFTINQRIITDLLAAATAHAKTVYGPRRAWPQRLVLTRPGS